ncbi:YebC/PmpR family DNA-binding transcriptional regulator [Alteribacillus sp. HJP-4]|uniref:YebC/PmpR family DNA-binding transcriptional regulator n=1 Tax=Alteribacillus sp. HJP-4 TaxID=2775394 RepID=UPI0035CD196A
MAGHSKWNNIKRRKESQDAKRAKIFTKLSKEIFAAVREGGEDPAVNSRLRMALSKAKSENIPSDNIERTIKKAAGDSSTDNYVEITYEGYGPGGAAVMVHALTENKNRTAADVRLAFSKNGGNLGENGCVSFIFNRKGRLLLKNSEDDPDNLMLEAIEAGAEEFESVDGDIIITAEPEQFEKVKSYLENNGHNLQEADITMIPQTIAELSDEEAKKMIRLIDMLEDNDDVQNVHHNFEPTDTQLAAMNME